VVCIDFSTAVPRWKHAVVHVNMPFAESCMLKIASNTHSPCLLVGHFLSDALLTVTCTLLNGFQLNELGSDGILDLRLRLPHESEQASKSTLTSFAFLARSSMTV